MASDGAGTQDQRRHCDDVSNNANLQRNWHIIDDFALRYKPVLVSQHCLDFNILEVMINRLV